MSISVRQWTTVTLCPLFLSSSPKVDLQRKSTQKQFCWQSFSSLFGQMKRAETQFNSNKRQTSMLQLHSSWKYCQMFFILTAVFYQLELSVPISKLQIHFLWFDHQKMTQVKRVKIHTAEHRYLRYTEHSPTHRVIFEQWNTHDMCTPLSSSKKRSITQCCKRAATHSL